MRIWTLTLIGALTGLAGCGSGNAPTAPGADGGAVAGKRIADIDAAETASGRAAKVTAYRVVQNERDFSLRFRVPRRTAVDELLVGSNRPRHAFVYKEATYRNLGWGLASKGQGKDWQEIELRIPRKWEGIWKDETAPLLQGIYLILTDNKQY